METTIALNVNGESYELPVRAHWTLLDVLRDRLALTGTKRGCDIGACGCCTVLIEGEPALSCMTLAIRCRNKRILTIEGLARNGEFHPLQEAAIEYGAVQCGFCTPGWLLTAKVLLDINPTPTREEIRTAISGNLCRCTGYRKIEDAILAVAARNRGNQRPRTALTGTLAATCGLPDTRRSDDSGVRKANVTLTTAQQLTHNERKPRRACFAAPARQGRSRKTRSH